MKGFLGARYARVMLFMLAACVLGVFAWDWPPSTYRAAALLKIGELPASATNVECWSRGWEDDFTQCVGTVDIDDIPALMAGWPFEPLKHPSGPGGPRPFCSSIPQQASGATRCYRYDTNEPRAPGYVTFSFNENTRRFYATIFRP